MLKKRHSALPLALLIHLASFPTVCEGEARHQVRRAPRAAGRQGWEASLTSLVTHPLPGPSGALPELFTLQNRALLPLHLDTGDGGPWRQEERSHGCRLLL